ncbi:P-loop containing nucleoside triphosphate hydrolase protein [Apiospora aurea]|uniref:P-loop containing nucleoside triphosphate hydrolase protein n=1 Tax=Apiospora aurea TaxID=335848 RepID=A0ABR1QNX2_9PEZI
MSNPAPRKLLIQMSGAPGAGKSTMAMLLQRSISGLVIDHDIIRSTLLEDYGNIPFDQVASSAYRLQWAMADQAAKQWLNVIIDSVCNYQMVLDQGSALAERHGYEYWYVECRVKDVALLDERLRARNPMRSQRTGINCPPAGADTSGRGEDVLKKRMEGPCRPENNVIIVDTSTGSLDASLDGVLKRIQAP